MDCASADAAGGTAIRQLRLIFDCVGFAYVRRADSSATPYSGDGVLKTLQREIDIRSRVRERD